MNLIFEAKEVHVNTGYGNQVTAELIGVSNELLLSHLNELSIEEVIKSYRDIEVLDVIGKDRVMEYFDLIEK